MSTALLDAPPTSQDYVSTCNDLRLVVDPIRKQRLGEGTDFINTPGKVIKFVDGRYTARDADEMEWLDNHESHGILFHRIGMGADGQTSDNSAEVTSHIVKLAFAGDYKQIADILIAERNSYSRPSIIAACETVLNEAETAAGATA